MLVYQVLLLLTVATYCDFVDGDDDAGDHHYYEVMTMTTTRTSGASMSRLRFAGEEMGMQETNLIAARGRITDVDIAAESTRLAKYNILLQASASMLAQANSSADVALMLLR